jgi:hypothetical protein
MLMDLDPQAETRPLERVKVIVRPSKIVVAFRRPPANLQAKACSEQRRLRFLRVGSHKIQVAEPASAVRIAGRQLWPLYEQKLPFIGVSGALQERGRHECGGPRRTLFLEKRVRNLFAGFSPQAGRQRTEAMFACKLGR